MAHSVHKVEVVVATLPASNIEEDRGQNECCQEFYALASSTSTSVVFNDVFLATHKRADLSETVTFIIQKCGESAILTNYGNVRVCPQDPLASLFEYDWRQYLINYTPGFYIISKQFDLLGATFDIPIAKVRLWEYTPEHAREDVHAVRIRAQFNALSRVGEDMIDFTDSGAFDTLRLSGIFHKWNPKPTERALLTKGRKLEKVKGQLDNEYTLDLDPLKNLFIDRLINLHLLNNNYLWITDNNVVNPRYNYTEKPVAFITDSAEPEEIGRYTEYEIKFRDRSDNHRSLHNKPA